MIKFNTKKCFLSQEWRFCSESHFVNFHLVFQHFMFWEWNNFSFRYPSFLVYKMEEILKSHILQIIFTLHTMQWKLIQGHIKCLQNTYRVSQKKILWRRAGPRINTIERSLLENIDWRTLLLESWIMSSYFESTLDCL